eukprot:CAMPEP_0196656534 /NCGR_PEP_ID=MMETSP1086-20130531/17619_1 /TAXON_ID=77921 /ORGANISM="Cyanoptyche  gloeocystis , Strain SAG4.97" /LENGTH=87 /DNA_ID=CAMNT_0041989311 /DNA_START=347 /DNA_END=611 /DNA_ORIENTATION=+
MLQRWKGDRGDVMASQKGRTATLKAVVKPPLGVEAGEFGGAGRCGREAPSEDIDLEVDPAWSQRHFKVLVAIYEGAASSSVQDSGPA